MPLLWQSKLLQLSVFIGLAVLGSASGADATKSKILHAFCAETNCSDGNRPSSGLVRDNVGNLYGSTDTGGAYGLGAIFELSRDERTGKWSEHVIHSFCQAGLFECPDGSFPSGPLTIDSSGNIYGTTIESGGAPEDGGVAFELMPKTNGSWKLKVLHTFCTKVSAQTDCADGEHPYRSGLSYRGNVSGAPYDGVSPLYGTAEDGGQNFKGVAFELTPIAGTSKWKETVIYNFCSHPDCTDGQHPRGKLTVDASGNLFGVAADFQNPDPGVAYGLSQKGKHWQETVLHKFCQQQDCTDGAAPSVLAIDAQGVLYGTTFLGGANDWGTIFKIAAAGTNSVYQVLYSFCSQPQCADGGASSAGVTVDSQGDLFGTTGDSDEFLPGSVFRFAQDGTLSTLHTFCSAKCTDGKYPESEVLLGPHNTLYGTTVSGGKYGTDSSGGTAFRLTY